MKKRETIARIKRIDADRQIVYAGVYAPNALDTYGEFMLAEDIETMAHRFMQLDLAGVIDTNHDNVPNGSYPIESYVNRNLDDVDFAVGEWVLGVKVDDTIWPEVLAGNINGYSFEALVRLADYDIEVTTTRDHVGETSTQKGVDHEHIFFVQTDDIGNVIGGITSEGEDGHVHKINHATMTAKTDGHSHRFSIPDVGA